MEMDKLSDGDLALFIHMDSGLDKSHKDQDYAKTFSEVCNEIARRFPGVDVKSWASEQILKIEQKERMAIRRHSLPLLLALMPMFGSSLFSRGAGHYPERREAQLRFDESPKVLKKFKVDRDPEIKRKRKLKREKAKRKRRKSGLR